VAWITGVGLTAFGRHEARSALDLMSDAAQASLDDAALERGHIDGLLCGYAGTLPHLMLADLFAEHFGLSPAIAHAVQMGGATGLGLVMLAATLVDAGAATHIMAVAGENRLTGQSRNASLLMLAGVGHPRYEGPLGPIVPAYYALLADRYLHRHRRGEEDLAELAVLMRRHAATHPGAHLRDSLTVADVMASRPIATPLKMLDCCPISDGAAAILVSAAPLGDRAVRIAGAGQAHLHQHISGARSLDRFGAADAAARAFRGSGLKLSDIDYAAIYDSFTITLALLLEELGLSAPGESAKEARAGRFSHDGDVPLNLHGGLLSYGHCGVAGAMAHLVEACAQMRGEAGGRQITKSPQVALAHADGGVLSAHVTLVLERSA
jgi:acetyl-CoA acetyltransferase